MKSVYHQIIRICSTILLYGESICYWNALTWVSDHIEFQRLSAHEKAGQGILGQITLLLQNGFFDIIGDVFLWTMIISAILRIIVHIRCSTWDILQDSTILAVFVKGVLCIFALPFCGYIIAGEWLFTIEVLTLSATIQIMAGWAVYSVGSVLSLIRYHWK